MKILLFIALILSSFISFSQSTVIMGKLEIMTKDLGKMSWDDAKNSCAELGNGWRLPTKEELIFLYENKEKIGGFDNSYYWCSKEYDFITAVYFNFDNNDSGSGKYGKHAKFFVRAVRNL